MSLVSLATRRRVTIAMATIAVLLFGMVALSRLNVNLLPELAHPALTIRTELEAWGDPKGLLPAWYPFALDFIRTAHRQIAPAHWGEMEDAIRAFMARLTAEEKRIYREPGTLDRELRYFYLSLESPGRRWRYGRLYRARLAVSRSLRQWLMPDPIRRRLVALLRSRSFTLQRSAVPELRRSVAELNDTVHELAAENYELRRALAAAHTDYAAARSEGPATDPGQRR